MGFLGGGAKKAAKKQAAATLKAAEMEAQNNRDQAKAAQTAMETTLAQKQAADKAAELLAKPMEQIDVALSPETEAVDIDPETGRRRTARSNYFAPTNGSGIRI